MIVKVIGGGGAFDDNNSSFLIETSPLSIEPADFRTILFDCNQDTFKYYKNNKVKLDYVFISHTHFDHISGLEQLIFYRYFIEKKTTTIITGPKVKKELEFILKDCNTAYIDGVNKPVQMFEIKTELVIPTYEIEIFETEHIAKPNYSFLIKDKELNFGQKKALIITGDTKATNIIKNKLKELIDEDYKITIFHDYSLFNDPKNNIHCCETDYKEVYKNFIDYPDIRWYLYHNQNFDNFFKGSIIEI